MELRIVSEDSQLLHILEAHGDDLLAERRTAIGLRGVVENRLLSMLPSGQTQAVLVAEQLGMSARSFRRQLAEEGTSFGQVRTDYDTVLRVAISGKMKADPAAADCLAAGIPEIGAFNHAFKRRTGTTPSRARKAKYPAFNWHA